MKRHILWLLLCCSLGLHAQINPNPNPFAAAANPGEQLTYRNPVIPGFYSDPTVCRVGNDYYLATSSFEYFPGIPVFHSQDLIHWEQIGHGIDRPSQLPRGINIFAPTLRYHKGTFYLITTNTGQGGNFYLTATNPAGPWSDPVWIDVPGIDPDLFFDEDGKTYVISSEFKLFRIDLQSGELLTEGKQVWYGNGGRYAEGPHLYKKDGFYYLMTAEGGTEEAHSECIARSNSIWGPYVGNPANPILAHANAAGQNSLIQGVGHADIIQAHDGSWWMVFHGYRKSVGYPAHHILGRETCLAPVVWPRNGWPVVNGNGTVTVAMSCPTLPLKPVVAKPTRDEFDAATLGADWNFIQPPTADAPFFRLKDGALHLTGLPQQISTFGASAFVGRRLQDLQFTASSSLQFDPQTENETAGLTLVNNGQHFDLLVKKSGNDRIVYVELHFGNISYRSKTATLKPGPVQLMVACQGEDFTFAYTQDGFEVPLEKVNLRFLSSETVGWFTGVYVGMYATGNGQPCRDEAVFDYFDYQAN
ncbi:glycoside hydrolase family 43 protein [Mangrovibacterium marinum]|uniref:Alpha-N-arabinofuranosidase n=1 Tax=Mangrovibacterium marinum TaxID=1639118 RepID=A0A2T5C5I5_9BACT|nr:glycoside hydrolase family 43 protein [Mangrovibacterium marinum]PTN10165.1 alpha-N-arabinofuranosidase [Mangrovibacterium marinum]